MGASKKPRPKGAPKRGLTARAPDPETIPSDITRDDFRALMPYAACGGKVRSFPHDSRWPRCTHGAGQGTEHPGEGYCKFHGGAANSIVGGKRLETNPRLKRLVELYRERDRELLDLREELVRMKVFAHALFEDMHPEGGDMHFDNRMKAADRLIRATDGIRKLVIKIDETLRAESIPLKSFIAAQQEMATTLMAILRAELPPEDVQRIGHQVVAAWDKIHVDLAA